jgi:hypothetical protein
MLLLSAIARLVPASALESDEALLQSNPALGHLSLTIIALVYVLLTVWQS